MMAPADASKACTGWHPRLVLSGRHMTRASGLWACGLVWKTHDQGLRTLGLLLIRRLASITKQQAVKKPDALHQQHP